MAVKPSISAPKCIESFEKQDCCLNVKKKNLNRHLRAVHGFTETQISNMSLILKSKPSANLESSEPKKAMVYTSSNIALMEQIPDGYNYNILTKINLSDGKFIAKFEILNFDVSDVTTWMLEMRRKCKTTHLSTNFKKPDSVVFKKRYRCHHNTRPKKNSIPRAKHLSCVATLIIQIEHTFDEIDPYDKPTSKAVVVIRHIHNHKIMCADVLKYRIPSDEVKEQILKLFEEGKSPSKALLALKKQLYVDKCSNYYVCAGDRGEPSDPEWVYYQYYKTFKKHFGSSHGDAMMISLNDAVDEYNRDCNHECSSMEILDDGNFIIAILSPLMRRISEGFDESGEVLFIDSSGNVDRYGCKVFFIYTNSCACGMLVGSLIVTSEATSIIVKGLELWKKMLSPESLGKRGQIGPRIFMTDDSLAERNALREVFPQTTLLLCIFHVLQAAWRYLWDSKHGIPLKHRPNIKNMIYSKDTDELNNSFNLINQNPITNDYPRFKVYVERLFQRRQEWAICLRNNFVTRGQNTNNISEAGVKIMKDVVLERTKAYSPVQ
ncbi:hypothetical protein ACI65C_002443 [Semiaphis heraclei]